MEFVTGIQRLGDDDFNLIKDVIYRESGIHLSDMKRALVQSRVMKRLRELKIWRYEDYCDYLKRNYEKEIVNLINCITTNKTDFFREPRHFEYMKDVVLPEFDHAGKKKMRLWSAGCSTGAEPYSMAMTLFEYYGERLLPDIKILATDIDTQVLSKGREGVYDLSEVETIDHVVLKKYFMKGTGDNEGLFKIKDFVKKMIYFRRLNLHDEVYPMAGSFDMIFCRNVIIYFDTESRVRLFNKSYEYLNDDGYLFMGHSETLGGITNKFRYVGNTIYRKVV